MALFHPIGDLLVALLLLLLLSRALGLLARRFGISSIVGEVLGGLVLSPLVLNLLTTTDNIALFAEFAIIVIMFQSGLCTDFASFRTHRIDSLIVGTMGVLVSFLLIFLLSLLVFGFGLEASLFLGAILSNTAIEVCAALLKDTKNQGLKSIVLGASFVDDIMAVFVLGVVLSMVSASHASVTMILGDMSPVLSSILLFIFTSAKVLAFLLITFYVLSTLTARILDRFVTDGFKVILTIGFLLTFILAIISRWVGLHEVIGAYLAGLIMSRWGILPDPMLTRGVTWMKLRGTITTMTDSLFAPLFFGFVGILLGRALIEEGGGEATYLMIGVAAFLALALLGKLLGCWAGARARGIASSGALIIGVAMGGRGALEFILIRSGLDQGILTPAQFSIITLVTLFTILLTPILYRLALNRYEDVLDEEL